MKNGIGVRINTLMLLALLFAVVGGYLVLTTNTGSAEASGTGATLVPAGAGTGSAQAGGGNAAGGTGAGGAVAGNGGAASGGVQDVYVRALGGANYGTYDKSEIVVKRGVPVRLHFTADKDAGCGRSFVVYGLNVRLTSRNGEEVVAEFTPQKAGTYEYSCSMRMFGPGRLIVQ